MNNEPALTITRYLDLPENSPNGSCIQEVLERSLYVKETGLVQYDSYIIASRRGTDKSFERNEYDKACKWILEDGNNTGNY